MIKTLIFVILLVSVSISQAAGPITHVLLGERWLAINAPQYTESQKKSFLLGTVFPDIRYFGQVKRKQTHFKDVTLMQVKNASTPFEQGVLFHSFVDDYRNALVYKTHIHKKIVEVPSKFQNTFLKLVEDQLLLDKVSRGEFIKFLSVIVDDEKKYDISTEGLMQWHGALVLYFTLSPRTLLSQISFWEKSALILDVPTVQKWEHLLPQYVDNKAMQMHVKTMLEAFDRVLRQGNVK